MKPRANPYANPDLVKPLIEFGNAVDQMGLEASLLDLVKIRSSQINGCAICLDMHVRDARQRGESEERIYMLDAWRESTLYSERERAALCWTEALTRLPETRAPDDAYQVLESQFDEQEQVKLTMLINVINSFNRFGVGFRLRPSRHAARQAA